VSLSINLLQTHWTGPMRGPCIRDPHAARSAVESADTRMDLRHRPVRCGCRDGGTPLPGITISVAMPSRRVWDITCGQPERLVSPHVARALPNRSCRTARAEMSHESGQPSGSGV